MELATRSNHAESLDPTTDPSCTTLEDHIALAISLRQEIEERLWKLAAVCSSVLTRWGDSSMSQFASEVGYSTSRVYELAKTWNIWQYRERSQVLPFSHHAIVARDSVISAGLNPETLIQQAEDDQMSVRELEQEIIEYRRVTQNREPETRTCPRCGGSGQIHA